MAIILLFAKRDYHFPECLRRSNYVYFIEHAETKKWWSMADNWTSDPHAALYFDTNMQARTYAVKNSIVPFIITEHEFVDPDRPG